MKKEGYYLFLVKSQDKRLYLLDGLRQTILDNKADLNYYYLNFLTLIKIIKYFLAPYQEEHKNISNFIKHLGGLGYIHGAIIDVDYNNHIYLNYLDRKLTFYYADSTKERVVYQNLEHLLASNDTLADLRNKYHNLLSEKNPAALILRNCQVSQEKEILDKTKIYALSKKIYTLGYVDKKVLRIWNDDLINNKLYKALLETDNKEISKAINLYLEGDF